MVFEASHMEVIWCCAFVADSRFFTLLQLQTFEPLSTLS